MLEIKPCNTYHAVCTGKELLRGTDGKTTFKVYFLDIVGRREPARTVWAQCGMCEEDFLARLAKAEGVQGVGFVTAFPHVTKVFRFGPEVETNLNVRGWWTRDLRPLNLLRGEDYVEFACLAEALIAADEFQFWAEAESVPAYLEKWSNFAGHAIRRRDKLARWWNVGRAGKA